MTLKVIWQAFMCMFDGKPIRATDFGVVVDRRGTALPPKALVIVNSGRVGDLGRLLKAVSEKNTILTIPVAERAVTVDAAVENSRSELRALMRDIALRHPVTLGLRALSHGSIACGLIEATRRWLRAGGFGSLELFTSNSRFVEIIRLAALLEGLRITEFLHGVSVDLFARYYDILEGVAERSGAELHYVNLLPTLPQPPAVARRLVRQNGLEAYFRNETLWAPRGEQMYDVLIVGSGILEGEYTSSPYFTAELAALRECIAARLDVVYCPHPLESEKVRPYLPKGVQVGRVSDHANSARTIVGHFSTVLFSARIMGHNVLVFPQAWERLPADQAAFFSDRAATTYSLERVKAIASARRGDEGPRRTAPGVSLAEPN